jgi:hypothetical protein
MFKVRLEPTPQQLDELRECSDRDMKKRYGVAASTWARVRQRYGIKRFRNPTTLAGVPTPWAPKPEPKRLGDGLQFWRAPDPRRDTTVLGEAASFLRRERFIVFHRKVQGGEGWQVGRSVFDDAAMLGKAQRLGFRVEGWMG